MAMRRGRSVNEEILYILKQDGGKKRREGQVYGECLEKDHRVEKYYTSAN